MDFNIIKRKAVIILFIAAMFICCTVPAGVKAAGKGTKAENLDANGEIDMNTDDIYITVRLGYKGRYKTGRSVRVDATIDNRGSDFTGKFRVEYPRHNADGSVMSQKTFAIASGETKKIQFAIPDVTSDGLTKIALCDENDKIICKKYVYIDTNKLSSQLYIGALSDSLDTLSYISNELAADKMSFGTEDEGYLFGLEGTDITNDANMLDALDIIIIDDFDTGKFSKGQIKAIKDWINEGGTLLLGSGADADKVLKAFSGSLLNGTIGSAKSIRTNFGVSRKELTRLIGENLYNKKIPLDITHLRIKGSTPVLTDGRERLITSVPYGKGNVLVSEFSLSLGNEAAKLYGRLIVQTLKDNLSDSRKNYIGIQDSYSWNSYHGIYNYYDDEALMLNETDSLPNLKLYGVLLIVYVILAGPVSYIITKKKDKRNLLWGIIPILSAAFSITIYLIGTSTRIQKPYINYISTVELPEKAGKENKLNTKFLLTSSSNKSYETLLPNNIDIMPSGSNTGMYYGLSADDMDKNDFDYGIEYGAENTKLVMNSLSAFESVYFQMNSKSSATGTVEIDISKKDDKLSGIINNKLSYDLEDCMFYNKGTIYYIGDFPAGKAFDISKVSKNDTYDESNYSFSFEEQLSEVFGGEFYSNSTSNETKRRYGMLIQFVRDNQSDDSWFYGFVANGGETGFTNTMDYDKYGETGVCKTAEVQEKINGYDIIGSLESYAYDYDSNKTDKYYVYDNTGDSFEVRYKFPKNFTLKKIIYNEHTTSGGEYRLANYGYVENAFVGEAKVLDKATGDYVTIIKSAQDAEIDNIDKYLEDDGTLIIYYDITTNQTIRDNVGSMTLPRVTLAGKYKRRQ